MNTTVEAISHEAAVQQTPSAPSDTITYSVMPATEEQPPANISIADVTSAEREETKVLFSVPASGHPAYVDEFMLAYEAAIKSSDFLDDRKKVEKATAAMKLPNPEERVRAQLRSHAERNLRARAAREAERTGNYVAPTEADFKAYVEQGVQVWREKQPK